MVIETQFRSLSGALNCQFRVESSVRDVCEVTPYRRLILCSPMTCRLVMLLISIINRYQCVFCVLFTSWFISPPFSGHITNLSALQLSTQTLQREKCPEISPSWNVSELNPVYVKVRAGEGLSIFYCATRCDSMEQVEPQFRSFYWRAECSTRVLNELFCEFHCSSLGNWNDLTLIQKWNSVKFSRCLV